MDCSMPVMDGYEASKLIKSKVSNEGYINPIIIAYTGYAGTEEEEKCKDSDSYFISSSYFNLVDGYLLKPCSEKCYLDLINNYI